MKSILQITLTTGIVISTTLVLPKESTAQSLPLQQKSANTISVAANAGYDKASKFHFDRASNDSSFCVGFHG